MVPCLEPPCQLSAAGQSIGPLFPLPIRDGAGSASPPRPPNETDGGVDDPSSPLACRQFGDGRKLESRDASRGHAPKAASTSRLELVRSGNDIMETPSPAVGPGARGNGHSCRNPQTCQMGRVAWSPGRQHQRQPGLSVEPSFPYASFSTLPTLLSAHLDLPRAATWDPVSLPPSRCAPGALPPPWPRLLTLPGCRHGPDGVVDPSQPHSRGRRWASQEEDTKVA